MKKKKLGYIIAIIAVVLALVIIAVFTVKHFEKDENESTSAPITEVTSSVEEIHETELVTNTVETQTKVSMQKPGIKPAKPIMPNKEEKAIDGWLKIETIGDYGGKLSFVIENVSDKDIEYAIIKCKAGDQEASFKVTALLSHQKAFIICNENISYNEETNYNNWIVENKVFYSKKQSLNEDTFEVNSKTGLLEIKNISDKNIKGNIYVCYKRVEDGVCFGAETYRVTIDGLKKGESKTITAKRFIEGTHKIIFVDYDK